VGGPGGLSVFTSAGGRRWVAYHSWERGQPTSNGRRLHVEPLAYDGPIPMLVDRVPTGSLEVQVGPSTVTLRGTVDDADTGRRMEVILKEGSTRLAVLTAGPDTRYSVTLAATPGPHTYCAFVVDDNGLGTRQLGCRTVEVPEVEPPPAPPPSTSTSTSSTTAVTAAPSTTSSTGSTSTSTS
jgi:hypothetical protein